MRYVEYNKWTGKIIQISSQPLSSTIQSSLIIQTKDFIIEEMNNDKRSLESGFIGEDFKAYPKNGIIHLPKPEKKLTEIKQSKNADVDLTLYINNKILEININYKALKTWYNHRMKEKFKFAKEYDFIFHVLNKNKLIKEIKINSNSFLETFQTDVDLTDINDLSEITILTKRRFPKYNLNIKKNKYYSLVSNNDDNFNKASTNLDNKKDYNIIISNTTKKNIILIKIDQIDMSTIYKSLDFWITGKDPNELYEVLSIPIEDLWNKKVIIRKINCEISDKSIWCNNKTLNIYFNKGN